MGILDDAIREHLELKRQHGAGESELEQLEGEAFGPSERPGSEEGGPNALAEAPTEFMEPEASEGVAEAPLAEPPSAPADARPPEGEQTRSRPEPAPELGDLQEAPEPKPDEPAEEESPAMEHEAIPEPESVASQEGPSTEERQAIADPPTELYDVPGEEFGAQAPSDEELADEEEIGEPRLAPLDPLSAVEEPGAGEEDFAVVEEVDGDDDDEDFFDEKRLSDELDQAMDAPVEAHREEPGEEPEPEVEPESDEAPEPEEPMLEEPQAQRSEEDVLEETPDFLEEAPEDDQLWFEQKPPKDFNFDD
jgi:hypothetical protein